MYPTDILTSRRGAAEAYMRQCLTENRACVIGNIDLFALAPGRYQITSVCRLTGNAQLPVREFVFEV